MPRLIDADVLINVIERESNVDGAYGYMDTKSIIDKIDDAPTVVEFDGEITKVIVRGKEYINPECGAEMET